MIGIIGGNGVAATNRLCQLIEERCTRKGAFRDGHHPEMLIWQATKVPSRSMYLEGKGPNWIEDYVEIGRKWLIYWLFGVWLILYKSTVIFYGNISTVKMFVRL